MQAIPAKKVSNGTIILIVIGGLVLLILIAVILLGTVFREDSMRIMIGSTVTFIKTEVRVSPPESLDTTAYLNLCDAYMKLTDSLPVNDTAMGTLLYAFGKAFGDEQFSQDELTQLEEIMISTFSELEDYRILTLSEQEFPERFKGSDSAAVELQ